MGTAVAFHREIGVPQIEARLTQLATALKEGVAGLGVPLVTPMEADLSSGVCILEVAGDRQTVFERLYRNYGIAGAATGGLRFSPHVYNTMAHIERAVAAVASMRSEIVAS